MNFSCVVYAKPLLSATGIRLIQNWDEAGTGLGRGWDGFQFNVVYLLLPPPNSGAKSLFLRCVCIYRYLPKSIHQVQLAEILALNQDI